MNPNESAQGLEIAASRSVVGANTGMRGQVTDNLLKDNYNDSSKGGSELNAQQQQILNGIT